jgi:signal transduction histidine kinase
MAQADLRRLDDAKTQFVSAAAHELRNPLAALIGYTEILTEEVADRLTADQQQSLSGIAHSALRLRQLTNNLLDLSRLDSDRLELVMQAVDPLSLLDGALAEMQPLMDAKQQQLLIKAEPQLPAIWCDKQRALQILVNLLSNANKYTAAGGRIAAEVHHERDEPFVTFAIRDEGIGIPADDQPQLFLRFYRAANATAADGAGAGLGLALTQSLVRLHGGRLWFESTQGKGATFYVTFPVAA